MIFQQYVRTFFACLRLSIHDGSQLRVKDVKVTFKTPDVGIDCSHMRGSRHPGMLL